MKNRPVIKLTPAAIAKIKESQKEEDKPYLRISVISGGSTGYMYDMKFDDQLDANKDYLDNIEDIQVVVDKRSAMFIEGTTIDWQTTEDGRQGFQFDNPNAE